MKDLMARIKADKWYVRLEYIPDINMFICELIGRTKSGAFAACFGRSDSPEAAIIDAIREMDR